MFDRNKNEPSGGPQETADVAQTGPVTSAAQPHPSIRADSRDAAVVGPSIQIDGDVRGEEDLLIKGHINGTVRLVNNSVTIGPEGSIKADVHAQVVYVEGAVHGDLFASERVVIRKDAKVSGSITAPSVSLDEGAKFKGTIEMDVEGIETPIGSGRAAGPRPVPQVSRSNGDSPAATAQEPAAEAGPAS